MAATSLISYCPNWETTHDNNIFLDFSETSDDAAAPLFPPDHPHPLDAYHRQQLEPSAAASELFLGGFDSDCDFLLLPETSPSFDALFNSSSGGGDLFSVPPQELELQPRPKRQKLHHGCGGGGITQNAFGVFIPNPPLLREFEPPPPPELPPFPAYGCSEEAERKREVPAGKTLSPQSIAARERRRRITEKTHELGKLIPGGQKMNTAEMFQAAYNYIKFMQAQVCVLQSCMSLSQENGEIIINEDMERLVGCTLVQEKLYSKDKCLVPEKLILSLPDSHGLLEPTNQLN
ncbi:hypothetical protein DM860_006470 [Cuscuta australis]|uniref:BHLH domain-containing protein n=1 Tax=Cuscuta australis TaxID=267555 RepID=A0A328D5H0_9ASTE|nr:hypothetical protein DM860_006470 [Cuscuta australis]